VGTRECDLINAPRFRDGYAAFTVNGLVSAAPLTTETTQPSPARSAATRLIRAASFARRKTHAEAAHAIDEAKPIAASKDECVLASHVWAMAATAMVIKPHKTAYTIASGLDMIASPRIIIRGSANFAASQNLFSRVTLQS